MSNEFWNDLSNFFMLSGVLAFALSFIIDFAVLR